jgi:hypothetical protein
MKAERFDLNESTLPSTRQLWRATGLAVTAATVLLFTIILPAEYGIDPTGAGRALGLLRPAQQAVTAPVDVHSPGDETAPTGATLRRAGTPPRTDEVSLVLNSGEGVERKAVMRAGQTITYSWRAEGGPVDVDMHGEAAGAAEGDFTSYWKDEGQARDHGTFTAPVTGQHGWFWQNLNDQPVTIHLKVSGFYERLITP